MEGLQKLTQKFGGVLAKNSPTVLTGIGVAGLIATTVLAVKATPKALELIDEAQYDKTSLIEKLYEKDGVYNREEVILTKTEVIKASWKCYLPAAAMGLVTISCIIGANRINLRRNAALASVYAISEAALKEYQAKVVETLGKQKERKIKDDIAKDRITKNPVSNNEVVITNLGETLCYDSLSGRYFKSDIEKIRQVLNKLSRDLMSEMFIDLNHVYSELNLKGTKMGDMIGWHIDDGLIEPDFSSQLTENGTPCLVLDFITEPRYNHNYQEVYNGSNMWFNWSSCKCFNGWYNDICFGGSISVCIARRNYKGYNER